jgi:hypothetical protein
MASNDSHLADMPMTRRPGQIIGEQIIWLFTEQLSCRSSQSLQLRGIYDV